jgi:class 3 adenylate cyclase
VIAGVMGQGSHHYEIWGDSLALAARLEQLGKPGGTLVSPAVKERLAGDYRFSTNGVQRLRGHGELATWWLEAREPSSQRWQGLAEAEPPAFI